MSANWQIIGFEDGSHGRSMNTIGAHRKACAKVGVVPNLQRYEQGHLQGLELYCTVENGYKVGLKGHADSGVCKPANYEGFLNGWNHGKTRYRAQEKVRKLNDSLTSLDEQWESLSQTISDRENHLVNDDNTPVQRRELLDEIKSLKLQLETIEEDREKISDSWQRAKLSLQRIINKQRKLGYD